jgi:hypothetical protein
MEVRQKVAEIWPHLTIEKQLAIEDSINRCDEQCFLLDGVLY